MRALPKASVALNEDRSFHTLSNVLESITLRIEFYFKTKDIGAQ